ncbi:MAG: ACP phosphodiesterase [Gammaproteobacteria bacterium]|nr:ACP phosphodiesterase [Gammaproteobacteria bacterium]
MNFLVHSWLARDNDAYVAGAFLGDFVKGPIPLTLPRELQKGIRLHRHIDSTSNKMEEMRSTYWRLGPDLRRVAPILLDLIADHILALHWDRYGEGKLSDFTRHCYRSIGKYEIPCTAVELYHHTVNRDLWANYADLDVILGIMHRILERLGKEAFKNGLSVIPRDLALFHIDFQIYFPALEQKVNSWRRSELDRVHEEGFLE